MYQTKHTNARSLHIFLITGEAIPVEVKRMAKRKKNPSERGKSAASVKGSPNSGPVEKFRDEPDHQTTNMQYKKENTAKD